MAAVAPDIEAFCFDDGPCRFAMDEPFVCGGWKYATDGSICVRVPTAEPDSIGGKYPPTSKLFLAFPQTESWRQLSIIDDCMECLGFQDGRMPRRCESCGGDGCWDEDEMCDSCHGSGAIMAPCFCRCNPIRCGQSNISQFYATRMKSCLPGVLYAPTTRDEDPVFFKFDDGGEGVVMPLGRGDERTYQP